MDEPEGEQVKKGMHSVRKVPGAGGGERGQLNFVVPGKSRPRRGAGEGAGARSAGGRGEEGRWAPTVFLTGEKKNDDEYFLARGDLGCLLPHCAALRCSKDPGTGLGEGAGGRRLLWGVYWCPTGGRVAPAAPLRPSPAARLPHIDRCLNRDASSSELNHAAGGGGGQKNTPVKCSRALSDHPDPVPTYLCG